MKKNVFRARYRKGAIETIIAEISEEAEKVVEEIKETVNKSKKKTSKKKKSEE